MSIYQLPAYIVNTDGRVNWISAGLWEMRTRFFDGFEWAQAVPRKCSRRRRSRDSFPSPLFSLRRVLTLGERLTSFPPVVSFFRTALDRVREVQQSLYRESDWTQIGHIIRFCGPFNVAVGQVFGPPVGYLFGLESCRPVGRIKCLLRKTGVIESRFAAIANCCRAVATTHRHSIGGFDEAP
jgi:hypothetical protein